jgi:uncharacterized membrane protein
MPNAIRGTYTVSGIVPGLDGKQPKYRLGQRIGKNPGWENTLMLDPRENSSSARTDAFLNPFAGQPAQPWDSGGSGQLSQGAYQRHEGHGGRLPAQAREGGPGKNVQGVMHITATAPIRVFMTSVVSIRENPMSDLAARSRKIHLPVPSTSITVVCLFCLLGLVITAAIVPMIPLEDISWVLSHIE